MVQAKASPVVGVERRCDPRMDRRLSLVNLLRTRAEQSRWTVAIVGTRDGHVLASSRGSGDRFAERAAAHLSCELFGRTAPVPGDGAFVFAPARRPEVRLAGRTLSVRGEAVFFAVALVTGHWSFGPVPASRALPARSGLGPSTWRK